MVNIEDLSGMAFQAESGGHTFEISGIDDTGAAVPLSGTVAGVFMRPDNTDVLISGAVIDGKAIISLTEDCYAIPGRFRLTVFVTSDDNKVAVYACVGTVSSTSTGEISGETADSIGDLIDAISAAVASIPSDYSALSASVDDLEKNTLNSAVFGFGANSYTFELGGISSSDGTESSSTTRIRTVGKFLATKGTAISLSVDEADMYVFRYNADGSYAGSSGGWVKTYTVPSSCLIRIVLRASTSNPTIAPADIGTIAGRVSFGYKGIVPLDLSRALTTDATSGFDANDFKAPGAVNIYSSALANSAVNLPEKALGLVVNLETTQANRLYQFYVTNTDAGHIWRRWYNGFSATWSAWERILVSSDIGKKLSAYYFDWNYRQTIASDGRILTNSSFAYSDKIPMSPGDIITNDTGDVGIGSMTTALHIATYNGDTFVERIQIANGISYTVQSGIDSVCLVYGYPSSNPNPPTMTRGILWDYFSVKFYGDAIRYMNYAAFGASTTAGAVHHQNGDPITYTKINYPEYVGEKLGLTPHNLGVGGTGFLSRDGGDNNIMDQIYNNDAILSKSKLITIMFGYGNDHYPGSSTRIFQIGNYTDYYPYDEDGYHPTGDAGINTMLDKGATYMGCLNWCIKWINEHYPYAQLVLIFGSPSANDERNVELTAQAEGYGTAPYTLSIAPEYTEPIPPYTGNHPTINESIWLIEQEINKLKAALNIPIIDLFFGGNAFSWYSTYARDPDDGDLYALFSTKGTASNPYWNPHPNEEGYLSFARFIAGKIMAEYIS